MRELSLNILDIAQNSISAGGTLIKIIIIESVIKDKLIIEIIDNGKGMDLEQLKKAKDPFYTTRTTRKVGLGIPLYRMAAELAGGSLEIESKVEEGTTIITSFVFSHIDRAPLGDVIGTITTLVMLNEDIDFVYKHVYDGGEIFFDTREIKEVLDGVPISAPDIIEWIEDNLKEQRKEALKN